MSVHMTAQYQICSKGIWLMIDVNLSVSRSTSLVQTEIFQQLLLKLIAMKSFTDIHGSQRMYPNAFSDHLTFCFSATLTFTF